MPEAALVLPAPLDTGEKLTHHREGGPYGPPSRDCLCPWTKRDSPCAPHPVTRFLGSLRTRLMLLHPSPNCSLRAESLVHVHFKEEIGIAELIPLVTTYIILFAYIYFSTRRSRREAGPSPR